MCYTARNGAAGENWTLDPTLTKGVLYHWATAAASDEETLPYPRLLCNTNWYEMTDATKEQIKKIQERKKQRMAAALRENLRKRKEQKRSRDGHGAEK